MKSPTTRQKQLSLLFADEEPPSSVKQPSVTLSPAPQSPESQFLTPPAAPVPSQAADEPQFPHVVIRASAGTGKTYQLSNRYIALVHAGQPPDQILAATFARKAAGEILGRVLVRLADAVLGDNERRDLGSAIGCPEITRPQCLELLRSLVRNLHRLRIGTLDSFFVQLAGSFSLDLGLPAGWGIVDDLDDQALRLEAIRSVVESGTTAETLALVHLLSKGDAVRSVTQQLSDAVQDLYDIFTDSPREAWHSLPRPPVLEPGQLEAAIERLAALPPADDKRYANAQEADLERARRGDWEGFLAAGLAGALATGDGTYYSKPIEGEVEEVYGPLIRHARGTVVRTIANQNEGTYRFLSAFGEAYRRLKLARRVLRFEDVPRLLAAGLADSQAEHPALRQADSPALRQADNPAWRRAEHVAWRLDTRVAHLLLDEFQDTSLPQWNVVEPFARHCVAGGGRTFFCVGDVKQAIYGWRGGVSEIFDAVGRQLAGLTDRSLLTSYRSSQPVIDTVNRAFSGLVGNLALDDQPRVAQAWSGRFAPHATARGELPGYCRLSTAPRAAEGDKPNEVTLAFAAAEIARLSQDCPGRSIGVLVRRNAAVGRLIFLLRSEHKIAASEEGGNPLTDSTGVMLVLSLLQLADHPGDRAARFHVASSPLGTLVGFTQFDDHAAACRLAAEIRGRLLAEGYGKCIYAWVQRLAASCGDRDLQRLLQLVELGYAFDRRAGVRPAEFVRYVGLTKVEDPAAADVRVMTVHQAKGLQFDLVVLPELDVNLKGQTPRVVAGRQQPIDPIERVCRYVRKDLQVLLPPEFQQMFEAWPHPVVAESLCLLYVMLTRAVHALHIIVAPSTENEQTLPKTLAGVLRASLAHTGPVGPEETLYEHGDPQWFNKAAPPAQHAAEPAQQTASSQVLAVRLRESDSRTRRGLERRSPSSLEGGAAVDLERFLRRDQAKSFARGSLVHAWLEQVEWLDDPAGGKAESTTAGKGAAEGGPLSDERLLAIARPLAQGQDVPAELAHFRKLLSRPIVRGVLSRAAYKNLADLGYSPEVCRDLAAVGSRSGRLQLQVHRERPFALREDDTLLSGTIDRLVLLLSEGKVVAADVIDFKTDMVLEQPKLDAAVEFYRPQLAAYRRAVAQLYRLPPNRVISRLLFVEAPALRLVD